MTSYNHNFDFNSHFKAFLYTVLVLMVLALASCLFGGCSPEKRMAKLLKKHPELLQTKTKDSLVVREHLIRHDTIITLPGKETTFWDTLPCPTASYTHSVKKNGLTASVSVVKGVLNVDCKADSLIRVIHLKDHIIDSIRNHVITHTITVEKPVNKDWWWWLREFVTIAVLAYFGFKYLGPPFIALLRKIPNFPF